MAVVKNPHRAENDSLRNKCVVSSSQSLCSQCEAQGRDGTGQGDRSESDYQDTHGMYTSLVSPLTERRILKTKFLSNVSAVKNIYM